MFVCECLDSVPPVKVTPEMVLVAAEEPVLMLPVFDVVREETPVMASVHKRAISETMRNSGAYWC